jgi:nondiscriminating glutamyl-tRNA synthetase
MKALFATESWMRAANATATALEQIGEWKAESIKQAIQEAGKSVHVKGKELFQPLRGALTGQDHGPELPAVIEVLGREVAVQRIRDSVESDRNQSS